MVGQLTRKVIGLLTCHVHNAGTRPHSGVAGRTRGAYHKST